MRCPRPSCRWRPHAARPRRRGPRRQRARRRGGSRAAARHGSRRADAAHAKLLRAVAGGERRQDSVAAGLASLPDELDLVAVHDAARALLRTADVTRVIDAAIRNGAALLAVPVGDTIKRVRGGAVVETPPRDECSPRRRPRCSGRCCARRSRRPRRGSHGTDCAQLVEALGVRVEVVSGDPENLKITDPADLAAAARVLEARAGRSGCGSARLRHPRAGPGRPLVLGGVVIPHDRGLEGHSDGDVLLHAVRARCSARSGGRPRRALPVVGSLAARAREPDLVARAVAMLRERGFALGNLDATLVAQAPRLAPHLPAMREEIAELLEADLERVNVKATSTDHLGHLGRGEGIAAFAVVLLEPAREPALPARLRVPADRRPAARDRGARRGRAARRPAPDAARRHGQRQIVHDGVRGRADRTGRRS